MNMNSSHTASRQGIWLETTALAIMAAMSVTDAMAANLPKRVEQKILAAAPGIDKNGDGQVTSEELRAGREKLPEGMRAMLDIYLATLGEPKARAFNALHAAFCDKQLTGPDAEVAAVISLMGAILPNHIDQHDPPVFIAHGTGDHVAPYAMVRTMVQRLDQVHGAYSFYPVEGVAHRLQTILDSEFDGRSVQDHSLGFCF